MAAAKKAPKGKAPKSPAPRAAARKGAKAAPPARARTTRGATTGAKFFATDDAETAYRHFLPEAQKLDVTGLEVAHADAALALTNARRGVAAISPHIERLRTEMPALKHKRILELPALALAFLDAVDRVSEPAPASIPSSLTISERRALLAPLRSLTLRQLEIFAELGLVPTDRVSAIRRGSGLIDAARDGIAIAGVFDEYRKAFAGKHPFTQAQLDELATHGNALLQALRPGAAAPEPTGRTPSAVVRDQFWQLLTTAHAELRKAAVYLFGEGEADALVPALLARTAPSRAAEPTNDEPAPAPEDPASESASAHSADEAAAATAAET